MIGTTWLLKKYHHEIQTYTIRAREVKLKVDRFEYFNLAGRSIHTGLVGNEPPYITILMDSNCRGIVMDVGSDIIAIVRGCISIWC